MLSFCSVIPGHATVFALGMNKYPHLAQDCVSERCKCHKYKWDLIPVFPLDEGKWKGKTYFRFWAVWQLHSGRSRYSGSSIIFPQLRAFKFQTFIDLNHKDFSLLGHCQQIFGYCYMLQGGGWRAASQTRYAVDSEYSSEQQRAQQSLLAFYRGFWLLL